MPHFACLVCDFLLLRVFELAQALGRRVENADVGLGRHVSHRRLVLCARDSALLISQAVHGTCIDCFLVVDWIFGRLEWLFGDLLWD